MIGNVLGGARDRVFIIIFSFKNERCYDNIPVV